MSKPVDELEHYAKTFLRLVEPGTPDGDRLKQLATSNTLATESLLPLLGIPGGIGVTVHPMAANCTGPHNLHSHTYFELVYMFRGSCTQFFEGGSCTMHEGSFCLLNTQAKHGISVDSPEDIVFNIIISRTILNHVLMSMIPSDSVLMGFFLESSFSSTEGSRILFEPNGESGARYYARALMLEYFKERPGYPQAMVSNLALLLIELMRTSIYEVEEGGGDAKLAPIVSYMQAHLDTVTLNDLADRFGYSAGYISRRIKQFTGKPFKEVVGQMRFARAEEQLRWSNESIEQIASELGYYDRSHFNREFKKRFGMSPSEYRDQARR